MEASNLEAAQLSGLLRLLPPASLPHQGSRRGTADHGWLADLGDKETETA